jgi:hypothetical protein
VARSLEDVIECFIPEAARAPRAPSDAMARASRAGARRAVGLPVARGDVLRAAVAWNLSVELSRAGAPCTLITHDPDDGASLWPPPGPGPLGSRIARAGATASLAVPTSVVQRALLLDCPPAESLGDLAAAPDAPGRWLLLASPDREELRRVHAQALEIAAARPDAAIGVTIHGVRRIAEARAAFEQLAVAVEAESPIALTSYGLLVDDLHLYRAIVAQRPIGLAHPAAPATRALADVARLLLEDLEGEAG